MIPVQDIITRCESALDAEGFDRYTFERDFRPAINYAQEWLTSLFSAAFGSNKFNEENLTDLSFVKIWKTNRFSRFVFQHSEVGNRLWTIIGIYPGCEIYPDTVIPQPNLLQSVYSPDHSYVKAYKSCTRRTSEEMNINRLNPFSAGNEVVICDELRDYAYKTMTDYVGGYDSSTTPEKVEIQIFPEYANKVLAMEYLKYPETIVNQGDNIEFPLSVSNMIVDKTLEFISFKQSSTPLKSASEQDLNKLITLMS